MRTMRTITFYSYKGGTGRTLAVANTARFLARFGCRVFALDLDLEAPGLHYKLGLRAAGEQEKSEIKGLVDFIHAFKTTKSVPSVEPYVNQIKDLPSHFKGSIRLMAAGNAPSPEYSHQLGELKLQELFNPRNKSAIPLAFPLFLELKARIESSDYAPDYLLIDSRTGVTEIGGVAVRLMPDAVVCLVHNNPENLAGARKVLRSINTPINPMQGAPPQIVAILARIPELRQDEENRLLEDVRGFFNEEAERPEETLTLSEILPLHSDPELQIAEVLRIGGDTTANESVLLRDYFKLFRKLGLDAQAGPEARPVLEALAEADRNQRIRPLLVGGRRLKTESALAPINMRERLKARTSRNLKVVLPAYLTGNHYTRFMERVRKGLCRTLSLSGMDALPEEEVRWDLLAVHLREGVLDFCADIYYLTENRRHLVEIVQLGWCRTFSVCVRTDSQIHQRLLQASGTNLSRRMPTLLAENSGVAVGVLGDTPAASEANRRFSPLLRPTQLVSKGSEEDLFDWLTSSERDRRIAVCDHVVAHKIETLLGDRLNEYHFHTFEFAAPIPVGVVYPKEDREWRKQLSKAIAESLLDYLSSERWDASGGSGSVAEDFTRCGLSALSLEDLRSSLLLDLTLDEGIRWNQAMQSKQPGRRRANPME